MFSKESGIYCFENIVNGKKYIGKAKNLNRRISCHFSNLRRNKDDSCALQNAWNKYKEENFKVWVVEMCEYSFVDEREIFWIRELNSHISKNGYNISYGGQASMRGRNHASQAKQKMSDAHRDRPPISDEQRKRMSEAQKGKTISEETRKKISLANSGDKNPNYGKTTSDEKKEKISKANTGKKRTKEQRLRCSINSKGRIHTEESKKKISESHKGIKFSEEHKKHLSESKQNISSETKEKIAKYRRGKLLSEETKFKISESQRGEKSSWWNKKHTDESKNKISLSKMGKKSEDASSQYVGVSFNSRLRKWKATFRYKYKAVHLGYFELEKDAAKAYNEKASEILGEVAKLNIIIEEKEE